MADTGILSARAIRRTQRANNLEIASFNNGTCEQHHGLPLCAFNRAGLPDVCYIMRLAEHERLSPLYSDPRGDDSFINVAAGSSWYFTPQFYQKAKMVFPITQKREIDHIGRTSFVVCPTFLDSSTGESIVKGMYLTVRLNKSTLRPAPLPAHFLERYSKDSKRDDSFSIVLPVQTIPDDRSEVFEYHLRVRVSDEDFLYHTNNMAYVRFALDAAADASMARILHNFPGDIAEYEVAKVELAYKAQSFAGDELAVYIWEDKMDNLVLHPQINKENKLVALCKFQFRSPVLSSNL